MTHANAARGRCPACGRVLAGRAEGIERRPADRRFVLLPPHVANPTSNPRFRVVCLPPGTRKVVRRYAGQPAKAGRRRT